MAAFQGDLIFQAPRRFLLEKTSKTQTAFAFRMFSHLFLWPLNHLLLVYKRGKTTPYLGAFHSSDIPEFSGNEVAPNFTGTDALGIYFKPCYRCCADTRVQLTLQILVTPLFLVTPKASSPVWTGSHGTRPLITRFWLSWTPLRMLASRLIPTE